MPNLQEIIEEAGKEFTEKGADLEHDRWARWQKYMFSKGTQNPDGSLTIPKELVERWFRQIDTKYADLSEQEKESDRKETRNYLPLLSTSIEKAAKTYAQAVLEEAVGGEKPVGMAIGDIWSGDMIRAYNLHRDQTLERGKSIINQVAKDKE